MRANMDQSNEGARTLGPNDTKRGSLSAGRYRPCVWDSARPGPLWVGAKMGQWLSFSVNAGDLRVEVRDAEIIIRQPVISFCAIYSKPADRTQLKLKYWTETEEHELLARACGAANTKARELGWIAK